MQSLKNKGQQDRSKINMHEPREVQYWTKHLKVSREELQRVVDKVGNGAAAVRKEMATEVDRKTKGPARRVFFAPATALQQANRFSSVKYCAVSNPHRQG